LHEFDALHTLIYGSGVFIKVTRSAERRYVQLVEAYRDDGGRPEQCTVGPLVRLDQLDSQIESVIPGLSRATSKSAPAGAPTPSVTFESKRDFGDFWTLTELRKELCFDRQSAMFWRTSHAIDVEALIRAMIFNRLSSPAAMDTQIDHCQAIDEMLASLLRPLVDRDLAVVFLDMTTIRTEGLSTQAGDVRHIGIFKECLIARQVMLGMEQTAEGQPLHHEVFDGKTAEVSTLKPVIEKIVGSHPVKRVIAVADRGLLSSENLAELQAIKLPDGGALEFMLTLPGTRYSDLVDLLSSMQAKQFAQATQGSLGEARWGELRLIVAHAPKAAAQTGKLEDQDGGNSARGRKLSDGRARTRLNNEVCGACLARIVGVDLKSERLTYSIDERALTHARLMDGKLPLAANALDLSSKDVVQRYKSLADIEHAFRVLKSDIEPTYHRLPQRIRDHSTICSIALILYRVLSTFPYSNDTGGSPEWALTQLRRIHHPRVTLNDAQPVTGHSAFSQSQTDLPAHYPSKKLAPDAHLAPL
jgi:hypothetical protein